VSILDDDVQLSFSGASYSVNENGTAISNITVTRSGRSIGAVSATLSFTDGTAKGCVCAANSVNNDFYNGTFVVDFADGETSKVIPVQLASLGGTNAIRVRDDAKVEGDEFFTISLINPTGGATIGAQNNATVTIIDNDSLPVLTVSFSQNTIAENAGVGAVTGTVTRDVATDAALVVTLASSDTTEAKVPQQVTIAAGQTSATFSIDAVDDTILDGNQNVTITATPLNGDTSIPLTGSAATGILQVTDSESPSLTLSIDREIVAETGTALATITRNTNTSNDLVVTIASSDTTEATAPQTVTILAGQTSANFTVSGVNDAITDGSQPVTITAAASGFTSSIKAINVTDIDVPDLVLTQLNPAVPTYTSKQSTFSYKLENKGIIAATAPNKPNTNPVEKDPWIDRVYLSTDNILDSNDKLLGEFPFSGSVAPGSFYERNITYFAPKTPGQYYLIGVTDATNKINEGIGETNNTVITPITVTPAYKATVSTDVTIANIGTNVILRGQANSTQDNSPVAFEFVKIKVENKGIIRELDAFTDGNGNFVKQFNPLPGEAGTYNINAYFPNNPGEDTASEDSFKLLGMRFEQNDQRVTSIGQKVFQGTTFNGSIKLQNLSDEALSGLTGSIVGAPSNWTVNINPAKTTLAGDEEITVNYTIDVPDNSIRNDIFEFELTTAEGVSVDIPFTIDVVPIVPKLVASTNLIKSGMLRGNQSFVEVEITNEGGDTANNIKVLLPDAPWLSLTSPTVIPTLAPGETTKVTLRLNPDATLPLTEYNGNLLLDVEGNDGDLSLPFNFRAVSNAIGDVKINISDELTYFAEGAPKLAGATVKILDYFTKEVIGTTVSDATGIVNFANIKEGAYELEVTAENHDTFKQTIQLDAGEFENVNAFLSRQAVKYIWTVTPTEIQDKYTISIESVFETNVPIPTIVIDPPLIDLDDLQVVGQVKQIEMTVTNQGLIAANDINLNVGEHPFYKIEPLIENLDTLGAKSSIKIPVRITRIADFDTLPASSGELQLAAAPQVPCSISFDIDYSYECAGVQIERDIPIPIVNVEGNCGSSSPIDIYVGGGGFSGPGGSGGSIRTVPIVINYQSCDPCTQQNLQVVSCVIRSLGGKAKGVVGAVVGGINCWVNIANGIKDFQEGNYLDLPKPSEICDPPDILDCLENICFDGLGGGLGSSSTANNELTLTVNSLTPSSIASGIQTLQRYKTYWDVIKEVSLNYYGDAIWLEVSDENQPALSAWNQAFKQYAQGTTIAEFKISESERTQLLGLNFPQPLQADDINKFIARWNRSIDYYESGIVNKKDLSVGQNPDFIAVDELEAVNVKIDEFMAVLKSEGYNDLDEATLGLSNELEEALSGGGGACAKVKLKIDQDAVLTRAAFLGELEIDNGSGSSLTNLSVNLQIKDENGNVVNELFGIDSPILKNITAVNGTGVLTGDDPNTPQDEGIGSAKWTFIPTNLAAPETPTKYTIGGTLAYIENGKAISVPLFSTPVTVYPQAELYLDYFHQRDVFADDPFTPEIEVSVPYNLAVLVQNQGKGDAKNLSITSGKPKIVDNDKGLLIDFNIIGSQVNNESVTPSLAVNFGNIEAGKTGVATWLLKSSLQGKFIDYKATFEHVNSLGKKELSLIKDVKIHELTRQVKVNHTNPDNLADFLVNDTFDANFYPDTLYFSSGGTAAVKTVTTATTDGNASNLDLEVKVTATVDSGWNYIRLADPANGQFQVKKVLRADGSEVNIENIWTTDRTFPGTGRPVYENILNLFDYNATAGNAQYTVQYTTGDNAGPKVNEILDVDPNPRTTPVTSLDVVFSEAIDLSTFDFNDFTLTRDGGANLITSAVTVTKINDTTYRINNLTGITGNVGDYQLTVNASGVKDIEGDAGVGTVTENWLVNGNKPAVATVSGIASNRRNTPVDNVTITFTEALNPTSFDLSDILLTRDNSANLINGDVSISQINATTYQINGLTNLTNIGGDYQLLIQATGVTDTDGNSGVGGKGFNWQLDGANPVVSDIIDLQTDPRNAPVSSLDVILSEPVDLTTFTYEDITLTLNGGANLITSGVTVAAVDDTTYRINGLNGLTTADGNYTLTVNGSGIADNFGNAGIGSKSETWLMDTIAPTTPSSLLVAGTSPNAGKFLINTTNPTITGSLGETGLQVFFYDKTSGNNLGQATVTGTTFTGTVALPTNGAQDLEIRVQDAAGNITNTPLALFADTIKPAITEFVSVPTSSVNPVDTLDVRFSEPIDLTTFNKNDLTLTRDGVALTLPDTVTVEFVSGNTYRIKGLQGLTTPLGSYQLQVDATTIKDNAGNSGDAPKTATFSIVAPPTPGITFTQTSGNTSVTEGGNTDTYSLILKTQPTADVTINLAFGNQITTDKNTLTFTAANWNVAQNITVTAVDDTTPEGNHTANITHTVSSTDTTYNTITLPNLNVNINDNDAEIRGLKWNDLDGDGIKDTNESGLKDWKIYLDTNTNGQLDTGEVSTTTDNDGNYSFTNLRPGTYTVTEETQPGWKQTFPGVSVTTTSSDIQLTTPSSPLTTTAAASGTAATNLVNLDNLWSDARFSNIKGNGYSTVIIDTGADLNHPLFGADADNNGIADKIVYQYDFADNDTDASDKNNHGSHIASIASAVAPDANLIVLKVFKDSGTGSFADLEEALQWVNTNSDIYNIASVNLSLGDGKNWNTPMSRYGIGDELAAIASQNVLISAAAGNGFYTYNSVIGLAYPAIDPSVISVGAVWTDDFGARTFSNGAKDNTTAPDRITSFSQRSPLLDVFAPGILITGANATGGTTTMGGTSQATPYISGIATLAQQIAKTNLGRVLTLAEFDTLLNTTSDLIIDGDDENDNITNTGVSYPRINVLSLAESILNLSSNGGGTTTPNNPTDNGNQEPLKIPDTNLNLVHTVTLTAGQVANNLNFGNQKLNQLPTLTNISKSASENASITFSSNDFTSAFSDADGNSLTKIKIASLPANGTFQLDGVGVTLDREIAVSELDKLVFTPNLNYGGNISFNWNGFDGTEYATNSAQANLKIVPLPRIGTSEKDNLVGTDGDDTISGLAGDDILDGGAGIDDLYGSDGSDELYGDAGNDTLSGDAGEDGLYGGDGNDILNGGLDNDELVGDAGDDILDGGAGIDDLYGSDGSDELYGDAGNDTLSGDAGDDGLYGGDGNDILNGGLDNDELVGDAGDDILDGGAGIDDLYGSDGSDKLYGDAGNDTLSGGDGDDTLNGGFGNDILMGNGGANIFEFDSLNDGIDTIIDFSSSRDKLQFSAASFGGGLSSAVLFNSDLLLTGSGADTATNASQRFIHNTDNGNLYFDVDGIGGARQVQIGILYNLSSLNTNNFAIV
jgi:hypothetical protein